MTISALPSPSTSPILANADAVNASDGSVGPAVEKQNAGQQEGTGLVDSAVE